MSTSPREFWDDVHRRRDPSRAGRPHPVLTEAVAGGPAGSALELGSGDGANAVWLAEQGWTVTAVDISPVALGRAEARAKDAGVASRIRWVEADLGEWTTDASFDLVAAFFVHTPLELDGTALFARAAERVRPGGSLLIVGHFTLPPWAWDPGDAGSLPSAGELVAALGLREPEWIVRVAEERERTTHGRDGEPATVQDAVLHAVRAAR